VKKFKLILMGLHFVPDCPLRAPHLPPSNGYFALA
jgi:hypothetical protein